MLAIILLQLVETKDLAYGDDKKQKLDLYMPKDAKNTPVLMWIHGGGWKMGDRAMFGQLGQRFAENGIGCAVISYRLTPAVQHPEHVKDGAAAFAWLHANVNKYGGNPDRLFVSGQSAGGHLTALLTLNTKYLDDLKVPADAIKGSIPMSGLYSIPALKREIPGMKMFKDAFGSDPDTCKDASPVEFVKNAKAPMLVITEADEDGGGEGVPASALIRLQTRQLQKALDEAGFKSATFIDAKDRNHVSIVTKLSGKEDDPTRTAMVDFIKKRCAELDK